MSNVAPKVAPSTNGVFVSTIGAMHGGKVLEDLDDAIREVTKAVNDSQIKGKLTLVISISPSGMGAGETPLLKVEDQIKVSLPKKPREPKSVFFADDNNNLTRRNPNQEEMNLATIEGGKGVSMADLKKSAATAANS